MKKRLICFLLVLVMVLSLIPAMAPMVQAADFYWVQVRQMDDYPDGYYDEYGHFTSQKPYDYDYNEYIHYSDGVVTLHNCHGRLLTCDSVEGLDSLTIVLEGNNSFLQIRSDIPVVIEGTGILTLTMHVTTRSPGLEVPDLTVKGGMVKCDITGNYEIRQRHYHRRRCPGGEENRYACRLLHRSRSGQPDAGEQPL